MSLPELALANLSLILVAGGLDFKKLNNTNTRYFLGDVQV